MKKLTGTVSTFTLFFVISQQFLMETKADCHAYEVLERNKISCDVKREIIKVHNEYRQRVAKGLVKGQPRASNMREMYWDEELARGAQKWASQCTFAHNTNKDREVARFAVGQNIGITKKQNLMGHDSSIEFAKHIGKWFDEHKYFRFAPIKGVYNVGHYTQLAWADTYLIGCGFVHFKVSKNTIHKLYICNYGPGGNVLGETPYSIGSQDCKGELENSKSYPGLCSMKKPPINECDPKYTNPVKKNDLKLKDNPRKENTSKKKQNSHKESTLPHRFFNHEKNEIDNTDCRQRKCTADKKPKKIDNIKNKDKKGNFFYKKLNDMDSVKNNYTESGNFFSKNNLITIIISV